AARAQNSEVGRKNLETIGHQDGDMRTLRSRVGWTRGLNPEAPGERRGNLQRCTLESRKRKLGFRLRVDGKTPFAEFLRRQIQQRIEISNFAGHGVAPDFCSPGVPPGRENTTYFWTGRDARTTFSSMQSRTGRQRRNQSG